MMRVLLVAVVLVIQAVRPTLPSTPNPRVIDPLTGKPDFSGRWLVTSPPETASTVGLELVVSQKIETQTIYGKPMTPFLRTLTVTRTLERGTQTNAYQVGVSGGVTGGVPRGDGRQPASVPVRSSQFVVAWRDDALSIETRNETRSDGAVSFTEHNELWSLDAAGMLVIVAADRGSSAELVTSRVVFRKA